MRDLAMIEVSNNREFYPLLNDKVMRNIIQAATKHFASSQSTSDRLAWWLLGAHSSERWMQFEWAYCIAQEFKNTYFVSCEQKRVDVALFEKDSVQWPIWTNSPKIGFELKWLGNWYNAGRAEGVAADVVKILTYKYDAAAIAFWLKAVADPAFKEYGWIQEYLDKGIGANEEGFRNSLVSATKQVPDYEFSVPVLPTSGFQSLTLHTFCYFNNKQEP